MKHVSFHAVMPQDRASKSASKKHPHSPWTVATLRRMAEEGQRVEVFALHREDGWRRNPGGAALVFDVELGNWGAIEYTGCSLEWLRRRTVRIPEALARKLHPEIVAYMED